MKNIDNDNCRYEDVSNLFGILFRKSHKKKNFKTDTTWDVLTTSNLFTLFLILFTSMPTNASWYQQGKNFQHF